MSGYRSWTPEQIDEAIENGQTVWSLDTGNDGLDDHLIAGDAGEAWRVIEDWCDGEIPSHWKLDRV